MSLMLRKIKYDDLVTIMDWRMAPQVTQYMYTDPELTMEKQLDWYGKVEASLTDMYWLIVMDDTPIGVLNLTEIDAKNQRCSWAYYIGDTSFRGRGIAKNLEYNIYDYVFEVLKLNKLSCEVFTNNERVILLHEKMGSRVEGVFEQHIYKNGQFYDIVKMGITAHRWREIKLELDYEKIIIEN